MSEGLAQPRWMQPGTRQSLVTGDDLRCAIAGRGLLAVTGADAAGFLHSQLSTDIRGLAPGQVRLTSHSDARGRLLAVMRLFVTDAGFLLELPVDRLDALATQLRRFVLRARVDIESVPANRAAFGLAGDALGAGAGERLGCPEPGPGAWVACGDGLCLATVDGPRPRWLVFGPEPALRAAWQAFDDLDTVTPDHWDRLDIAAGLPAIHAATAGHFVAQMVNLDRLDALDFRKGCYPGQEVIARTHYLGRVKRRMFPLRAPAAERPPVPGEAVTERGSGKPVGEIVRAAPHPEGGCLALAVLRLDALDAALALADGTPATRRDPPYPLDEAA